MRIAVLNWYANRTGGADVYTRFLCLELSARGHEVHFIGYDADADIERIVTVHRLTKPDTSGWRWRLAAHLQFRATVRDVAELAMPTPDVLIGSPPFALEAMRRKFPNVPAIYLPHARIAPIEVAGYLPGKPGGWVQRFGAGLYAQLERKALVQCARTVRFTPGNAKLLADHYGLTMREKFEIIPPPVDLPEQVPSRPEGGPLKLLSLGRLIASKNIDFLLGTLATLPADAADWKLDVVGDGPERTALERRCRELGLASRVVFHGQVNDPARFHAAADLFVFPTLLENTPLVILEAMAHGLPTLAIREDGVRYLNCHHEMIDHDRDGILAADESDFSRMLVGCVREPQRLVALGLAARTRVEHDHTKASVGDRWERLLSEVMPPAGESLTTVEGAARA